MRKKTKAVPSAGTGQFNQQRMIDLWAKGKSVAEIAEDQGCSPVYARRVLSTKAPEQYTQGLALRHAEHAAGTSIAPVAKAGVTAAAKANGGNGNGRTVGEAVEIIARAVAQAAFANTQLVTQPTTREEMFRNISKGVSAGVKKLGIGFHS